MSKSPCTTRLFFRLSQREEGVCRFIQRHLDFGNVSRDNVASPVYRFRCSSRGERTPCENRATKGFPTIFPVHPIIRAVVRGKSRNAPLSKHGVFVFCSKSGELQPQPCHRFLNYITKLDPSESWERPVPRVLEKTMEPTFAHPGNTFCGRTLSLERVGRGSISVNLEVPN